MATVQVIQEGYRNLTIKVTGTGVETSTKIVDVSTLSPPCTRVRLSKITYSLEPTQHMQLLWDAAVADPFLDLYGSNDADMCFEDTTGLINSEASGATGNVLLSGGTASTAYTLYISFLKSNPVLQR